MIFSLIIPAWNEAEFLPDTLLSLQDAIEKLEAQSDYRCELIVVDNNSTDNTAKVAAEHGAIVVFEELNQIARARNRGASIAHGEHLIFLDADSRCTTTLLKHVLDCLALGKTVGGGSIIAPDKVLHGAALRTITIWNWLAVRGKLAAGCFVFCRKDAFDAIGGFSTRVYAGEEIYLSRALKKWGRRHSMMFHIATLAPVITSVRKLEWYGTSQLVRQALVVLVPGALYSKRFCKLWYDDNGREKR